MNLVEHNRGCQRRSLGHLEPEPVRRVEEAAAAARVQLHARAKRLEAFDARGAVLHEKPDVIDDRAGAASRCFGLSQKNEHAGELDTFDLSKLDGRSAQPHPEGFARLDVAHVQVHMSGRDAGVVRWRQLRVRPDG